VLEQRSPYWAIISGPRAAEPYDQIGVGYRDTPPNPHFREGRPPTSKY
jgi:hypothetical protein